MERLLNVLMSPQKAFVKGYHLLIHFVLTSGKFSFPKFFFVVQQTELKNNLWRLLEMLQEKVKALV